MEDPRQSKTNWSRWNVDRVRYRLDKPPAPNRDIQPIGEVLKDVVSGLEQPRDENILLLQKAWPEIAGEQIAKHSEPASLQSFVLCVDVDHPGWLPELERMKRILLQKLQARYRELRIRKLHFSLRHR
jgi:predicted nucleic acid-binding Zn ribbon protein